jgi:hypothetical protein
MSSNALDLLFRIRTDGSQSKDEIKSIRSEYDKELKTIKDSFKNTTLDIASSFGISGTAAAQFVSGLKAASVAITAIGGVAIAAGAGIFALVKSTVDAADGLYDMSQRTAFTVETLSALKLAGEQSGTTLEQIGGSLVRFINNLNLAATGSGETAEKLAVNFRRMGVDATEGFKNPEAALATFIDHFAKLPTEQEKVNTASEIFGKRTGAALVGVFNQVGGSVEDFKAKLRDMGILIDTDTAKTANDLSDLMKQVSYQFEGAKRTVAMQFLPVVSDALKQFSTWLKENKGAIAEWAKEIADKFKDVQYWMRAFRDFMDETMGVSQDVIDARIMRENNGGPIGSPGYNPDKSAARWDELEQQFNEKRKAEADKTKKPVMLVDGSMYNPVSGTSDDGEGDAEARRQAADKIKDLKVASDARLEILKTDEEKEKRIYQTQLEAAKDAYEKGLVTRQQYVDRQIEIEDRYIAKREGFILREREELDAQYEDERQRDAKDAALDEKANQARIERDKKVKEYQKQADKEEDERQKKQLEAKEERQKISDDARIAQLKDDAERRKITYKAAEDAIIAIQARSLERQGLAALEARNKEKEGTAEYERLNNIYLAIQEKAAAFKEEVERRKREALKKTLELETAITTKAQMEARGGKGAQPSVGGETIDDFTQTHTHGGDVTPKTTGEVRGLTENMDAFQAWGDKINGIFGLTGENAKVFGQIISQTFGQVAQAVGDAVKAFVLFGSTGGSLRKFAAEMIASIAAMAAVQAVYELAQGLAWTALNYFFPNPKYAEAAAAAFASAAVFGSIAGVSVVAGRALAGNAFSNDQKQSAAVGSATGGMSRTSGTSGGQPDPRVIDVGRTLGTPSKTAETHAASTHAAISHLASVVSELAHNIKNQKVEVQPPPDWVVKEVTQNYRQNGKVRDIMGHFNGIPGYQG